MKARSESGEIEVFDSRDELAAGAARFIVEKISEILNTRPFVSFVLSGGSTPRALYELLASEKYREKVPWEKVLFFFGDERCVSPNDDESNFRMAKKALLSRIHLLSSNIFRMKGEIDPGEAAAEYERDIRHFIGLRPVFDIVLLGLGPDGHTASLFPGSAALNENEKLVAANFVEKFDAYRLTLTFPVLNAARNILFLVAGKDKAETLKAVFEGNDTPALPAQLIQPTDGKFYWLLDKEAAQLIR